MVTDKRREDVTVASVGGFTASAVVRGLGTREDLWRLLIWSQFTLVSQLTRSLHPPEALSKPSSVLVILGTEMNQLVAVVGLLDSGIIYELHVSDKKIY